MDSSKEALAVIEKEAGVSPADFEPGERFYCLDRNGLLQFGSVKSSEPEKVVVKLDNGQYIKYEARPGVSIEEALSGCGKPLDPSQLKVGSVVSVYYGGKRHFFEITRVTPDEVMAIFTTPPYLTHFIQSSESESLEYKMAYWELEG